MLKLYDTTLRDGTQAEDINFSVEDKVRIAQKLGELGIHYIEGGWPGSNPRDIQFFKEMKSVKLTSARLVAFGSTRRAGAKAKDDANIKALLKADTGVITLFGKSWDLHVKEALKITPEENLDLICDSLAYLKERVEELFYDAEHFFDGYKANPEYALKTLKAAQGGGAECLILCGTTGATFPRPPPQPLASLRHTQGLPCSHQ